MYIPLLGALLLLSVALCDFEPYPVCDFCLPTAVREAPGIGFDISFSYGTSSVNFYNDTQSPLAHVSAASTYTSLMQRLAFAPKPICNRLCQLHRRLNKLLGYPASQDVGILSVLFADLKAATEARLGSPVDCVAVSAPPFLGVAPLDINDAIEYAGFHSWMVYGAPYPAKLESAPAAYAANGQGLCKDYRNLYFCWDEMREMRTEYGYAIIFTSTALSYQLVPLRDAFAFTYCAPDPLNIYNASFDLGLSEPRPLLNHEPSIDPRPESAESAAYWSAVSEYLYNGALLAQWPITTILLLGEHASLPKFHNALKDALARATIARDTPPIQQPLQRQILASKIFYKSPYSNSAETEQKSVAQAQAMVDMAVAAAATGVADPLFAASKGAAVYARRRQECPYLCEEPEECFI